MGCGATNGRRTLKIYTHARGRSLALARPTPHEKPSPSAPLNTSSHARSAAAVSRRICKILALLPPACAVGVAPALVHLPLNQKSHATERRQSTIINREDWEVTAKLSSERTRTSQGGGMGGEIKKTDNPREGWEDGTPPPHRDFKGRSAVLAVAHPCASTFSYLCSQFLANSRSDLHATSRSSHSRPRSLSCCFKTQNGIAKNLSLCFIL